MAWSLTRKHPFRIAFVLWILPCVLQIAAAATPSLDEDRRPYSPTPAQEAVIRALVAQPDTPFAFEVFASTTGPLPYRLLLPPTGSRPMPLVIVLHGSAQIGVDNTAQMGPLAKAWADPSIEAEFPAFVVAPQFPVRSADYGRDLDGQLFSLPGPAFNGLLELTEDLARRLPVDRSRIYVVGFSMGASTALQAMLSRPDLFAAAVSFSPVPPARELAKMAVSKPVMLVHGSADTENPFEAARLWVDALRAAGGQPRFVVYDGMGHRVAPDMAVGADWRAWLFGKKLN